MEELTVRCADCDKSFTDAEIAKASACPSCGSKKAPELLGRFAVAQALVDEYYAVKPALTGRDGARTMTPKDMTARQQVGMWIVQFGMDRCVKAWRELPDAVRQGYDENWPGFSELLFSVCTEPEPS